MPARGFLVFDVESRIDKALILATQFPHLSNMEAAYQRFKEQLSTESQGRSDFIPWTYHRPISIAVGHVGPDYVLQQVETLGQAIETAEDLFGDAAMLASQAEKRMVEDFWQLVNEGHTLVTFNGRGFDFPVLELAALRYGVQSPLYWTAKYGARNRFSEDGHLDLQDILSNFGATQLRGGLNVLLTMLSYIGKAGIDGSMVQEAFEAGEHEKIHQYCRRDVICTWALFIRLELIRGRMTPAQYTQVCEQSAGFLNQIR